MLSVALTVLATVALGLTIIGVKFRINSAITEPGRHRRTESGGAQRSGEDIYQEFYGE
jgi:hypothetical protein